MNTETVEYLTNLLARLKKQLLSMNCDDYEYPLICKRFWEISNKLADAQERQFA